MRQAGRSLPEYRKVREGIAMLDSCLMPELAAEITIQPVRRHKVDAGIFFSDIVVPVKLAGVEIEIVPGVGPVMETAVDSRQQLAQLASLESDALEPIRKAVQLTIAELGSTPLIGFGGAPFTLASYLIEGGPSKTLPKSRAIMKDDPELWDSILSWAADVTAKFIRAQVEAGASALQLFDSWAGRLSHAEYVQFAAPYSKKVFDELKDLPVPRVHFGLGTGGILREMKDCGATVMGVDYLTTLAEANQILGGHVPLQGNINPDQLSADWPELKAHIDQVLRSGLEAPGHVVNLGHGVPPETDPEVLTRVVEYVHEAML